MRSFHWYAPQLGLVLTKNRLRTPYLTPPCCRGKFTRWQDSERERKYDALEKRLKKKVIDPNTGVHVTAEDHMNVMPVKPWADRTHQDMKHPGFDWSATLSSFRYKDWSPSHVRRRNEYKQLIALQYDQRFIPQRHVILGPNLAAATFITHRGGAVKFLGKPDWVSMNRMTLEVGIPTKHEPGWEVEAIDASKTVLLWEGFDNLRKLKRLRMLMLADCPYMNDWCMDKMKLFSPSLEFLDLSRNPRISARGLTGLASLKKLKFLRLEGMEHDPEIPHVALMLEEAIPGLHVLGLDYDRALDRIQQENELLDQPNVYEDALGNVHLKDKLGEWYFLKGHMKERKILDEFGLPLYISKLRKDPPELEPEICERINQLSDGKLKHLLVGSPSGEWTIETERILSFEAYYMLKRGEEIEPLMIPECMKHDPVPETLTEKLRKFLPIGREYETNLPKLAQPQETDGFLPARADFDPNVDLETVRNDDVKDILLAKKSPDSAAKVNSILTYEIKSKPPKPRPPRLLSKFSRYSADALYP